MHAVLPDTNAWLEAKLPLNVVAIASDAKAVVVLPQRVLAELDQRQHEGRAALKKRARRIVMWLNAMIKQASESDGTLEFIDGNEIAYRLVRDAATPSGTSADNIIVATAAALRSAGLDCILVTADAAMQMSARLAGVPAYVLREHELDPDEGDQLEQKVAALEKQLAALQEPQRLVVQVEAQTLWPRGNPPEMVRLAQPTGDELDSWRRQTQVAMRMPGVQVATEGEDRAYLGAVPGYAGEVAEYLRERARWEAIAEAGIEVQVVIINRTTQPVTDAVLELTAPPHVIFKYPPPQPERPTPPRPPVSPAIKAAMAGFGFDKLISPSYGLDFPYVPTLNSQIPQGPKVRAELRWAEMRPDEPLRPDHEAFAGRLWIGLEPEFEGTTIAIPYVLYAAAAGKPVSGECAVPIAWRSEAWQPPTVPTFENPNLPDIDRTDQRHRESEAEAMERGRR